MRADLSRLAVGILAVGAGALAFLAPGIARGQEGSVYTLRVFTGQAAPGGGVFGGFGDPVIGGGQEVAFRGWVEFGGDSESSFYNAGVWSGGPDALALVAREGQSAPGISGAFYGFDTVALNGEGQSAFLAYDTMYQSGIWAVGQSGLLLGLTTELKDPISPFSVLDGRPVVELGSPAYSANDVLVAKAWVIDPIFEGQFSTLAVGRPGQMRPILTAGDPAPDGGQFPVGTTVDTLFPSAFFSEVGADEVAMNDAGQLAFLASVGLWEQEFYRQVIYAGLPGGLRAVAVSGTELPGVPGAEVADLDPSPAISSNGLVSFWALFFDDFEDVFQALYVGRPGNIRFLLKSGDAVPSGPAGSVFGRLGKTAVTARGDVIFEADIVYANDTTRPSVWLKRDGEAPVLVAAQGNLFPTTAGLARATDVSLSGQGAFNDLNLAVFRLSFDEGQGIYQADTRSGYPVVSILRPATRQEQVTTRGSITIAGTAVDDSGRVKVELTATARGERKAKKPKNRRARRMIQKEMVATAADDGRWSFNVPLQMGRNRISVRATDQLGNAAPAVDFTVIRWRGERGAARK